MNRQCVNLRIVRRYIDLIELGSICVPFGFVFEGPKVIGSILATRRIRVEKRDNPFQCIPRWFSDGNRMIDRVVVDQVELLRDLPNDFVVRVHALAIQIVKGVRRDRAIHVRDHGITQFSAIVASGSGHLSGRTTEITGLRQVNSPSESARPATPVHFIVRRVLGYCNEGSHSKWQLDQRRSGRLIRKS